MISRVKILIIIGLLSLVQVEVLLSQSSVSGVVNTVASAVTNIESDRVTVGSVAGFAPGDTVLIIQMKGVVINTPDNVNFGFRQSWTGAPGSYEFLIVSSVIEAEQKLVFSATLINNYNVDGVVQVVRVPYYESAVVDGVLTAPQWDSSEGTGGVLAMIVGGVLELQDDIDVTGKGFAGGAHTEGDGICAVTDLAARNRYFFNAASDYGGFKGEGLAITNALSQPLLPDFAKGKGPLYNSGGGGNGRFSGGGGGGNTGEGGNGGFEDIGCGFIADIAGIRGYNVTADFPNGIFAGGGGGSSTYVPGGVTSAAGNGGGIVIIIADEIRGNNNRIVSSGSSPSVVATGEAGAAGGGAGGTVAISVVHFDDSPLTIISDGGTGGHTDNDTGAGGGGGGGLIWLSTDLTAYPDINTDVTGGMSGFVNYSTTPGGGGASNGGDGLVRDDFSVLLNGFLFNSVWSSVTELPIDSICFGNLPHKSLGTTPLGGTAPYDYQWQRSYDPVNPLSWTNLPGTSLDFTAVDVETDTVWFRRIVTDSDPVTPLTDISKPLKIIVHPLITDNLIGSTDTICYDQVPLQLGNANGDPGGGSGFYHFIWQESADNILFDTVSTVVWDDITLQPEALTQTRYYHRVVRSGMCLDTSNIVTITVLPLIENNTILQDQTICESSVFATLTGGATPLSGGDDDYRFLWQSTRISDMTWNSAAGTVANADYDPDITLFPDTILYRRVVYSGSDDVCSSISDTATLIMHPEIAGNTISADQTICSGSIPSTLTGPQPTGGDAVYIYNWQRSTDNLAWDDIAGANAIDYSPPALTDTTWYRRVVISSDGICSDVSNTIVVNVHKPLLNFDISLLSGGTDTTLCRGATPNLLTGEEPTGGTNLPGDYQFLWEQSLDGVNFVTAFGTANERDYQPSALAATNWFRRRVSSGECVEVSSMVVINILELIDQNNIPSDTAVCYNTAPALLTGSTPTGGNGVYLYLWQESTDTGATWDDATGANTGKDYQPPVLTAPVQYRRLVLSGPENCCSDISDPINISIDALPVGVINTAGDAICGSDLVSAMNISLTGASPWNIEYSDGVQTYTVTGITTSDYTVTVTPERTGHIEYVINSVTDGNSCHAIAANLTGTFNLMVLEDPVATPGVTVEDEICGPDYQLSPLPTVGVGEWLWPGVPVSGSQIIDPAAGRWDVTVSDFDTWSFWWKETNAISGWYGTDKECIDSAKIDVTFWDSPSPVEAGDDFTVAVKFGDLEATLPVRYTSALWSYQGDPDDILFDDPANNSTGFTISGAEKIARYNMIWTVDNGLCSEADTVMVTYNPIPQGFSPDGDNINDLFEIPGLENTDNELVVLNMSGSEVIRFNNYNSLTGFWNGKDRYGKDLPDGTYYYFLTITRPYSERLSGFVIIKRGR